MEWTTAKVKYRLHYWWKHSNYAMGGDANPIPKVGKKTRHSDAYFVGRAFENAFFDESFGILTMLEQLLLVGLFMDGSEDKSYKDRYGEWQIRIFYTEEAMQKLIEKTERNGGEIDKIASGGIGKMTDYLNQHEGERGRINDQRAIRDGEKGKDFRGNQE